MFGLKSLHILAKMRPVMIVSLFVSLFALAKSAPTQNIPATELTALFSLYNATDGPNWNWLNVSHGIPWAFGADANPCRDNWQGIGCPLTPPFNVLTITLEYLELKGTLPHSIGDFAKMQSMHITHNAHLNGTIPASIGSMPELLSLDLSRNSLSGTIPHTIANLTLINTLLVDGNHLNGTVPHFLCEMTSLQGLSLAYNKYHGTVPACLGHLPNLYYGLSLSNNHLIGTIPSSLANLTILQDLDLHANSLTGPIPFTLGNMTALEYLFLFSNALTSTIPPELGNLTNLIGLYAYNNLLTGTLPDSLGRLSNLQTFDLNNNSLHGKFPSFWPQMTHLSDLSLYYNLFSGSISDSFVSLAELTFLEIYDNKLTGPIPSALGQMQSLQYLEVSRNYLTSTLPASIVQLSLLQTLQANNNLLTGSIPETLGVALSQLEYLLLNDNLLQGSLPPSISSLGVLVELFLQNNRFTGSISNMLAPATQPWLETIQLSGNQLTGEIPDSLFALPALTTLAAVSNCFETTLTEAVCACTSLVTLALDGLQSASSCQQTILPGISKSYLVARPARGGIPACLFEMPNLHTLHLSGNGISGSLPASVNVSRSLIDLALSHNSLTGTIPESIESREWYNLDLSYNRLSGSVDKNFASTQIPYNEYVELKNLSDPQSALTVSLENNRLSGRIPHVLQVMRNVSMLGSNIFACDVRQTNLPSHDTGTDHYTCGSDGFNFPFYFWLAAVGMCVLLVALLWWRARKRFALVVSTATRWTASVKEPPAELSHRLSSFFDVTRLMDAIGALSKAGILFVVVVLLPFFAIVSAYYGTFTHQYAWTVSAAFLSGKVAGGLEFVFFVLFMVLILFVTHKLCNALQTDTDRARVSSVSLTSKRSLTFSTTQELYTSCERVLVYVLFMLISFTVVLGVNVAYVYTSLYQDSTLLLAVQILLSFFKLFWSKFCATYLIRWTTSVVLSRSDAGLEHHGPEVVFVLLFVTLVNNIAIPCLVVAAISPNCFYNIFVAAPVVHSTYRYEQCALINDLNGECLVLASQRGNTSFDPPFVYSYQCSSSFITYYAPAFVFLCITATFLTPASYAFSLAFHRHCVTPNTRLDSVVKRLLPRILREIEPQKDVKRDIFRPYLDANRTVVTLFSYLGMLLTFGSVFPPLAVAIFVTLATVLYFTKLQLGRFLSALIEKNALKYAEIIEQECKGAGGIVVLRQSVWLIVTFTCLFYALFLFDTLGDALGFEKAYWVLIVMPLMPVVLYIGQYSCVWWARGPDRKRAAVESMDGNAITLSPLAPVAEPVP